MKVLGILEEKYAAADHAQHTLCIEDAHVDSVKLHACEFASLHFYDDPTAEVIAVDFPNVDSVEFCDCKFNNINTIVTRHLSITLRDCELHVVECIGSHIKDLTLTGCKIVVAPVNEFSRSLAVVRGHLDIEKTEIIDTSIRLHGPYFKAKTHHTQDVQFKNQMCQNPIGDLP